ncbi:hypothetical protein [Arenimonas metalli]|uniref:Uncharacterized protein n=1 Tax=Arenimonas metalli CF5-1 TaxID=1384056 RepID=A0A091BRM8_9GAMM|nr:hypothetical protein [Arenimonas metalli]KFN46960.1 hypothetical protein N787_01290 [Arenimonas metalli CF5-1]
MNSRVVLPLALASAILLGLGAPALAAQPGPGPLQPVAADTGELSPAERGELTRQLVLKWGHYVERVHGVPLATWAERMVPNLVVADSDNFRNALQRDTFEGTMAELGGGGQLLSDEQVIEQLAAGREDGTLTLGALGNDLVYTPVAPCRILDTRNVAAGAIAANSTRNFVAFGVSSFASQGGSATNCGVNPLSATAVAINLTAVNPGAAGYATAYPFGSPQPLAASINYAAGTIVNNALIVQTPNPISSFDFTLYTFAQAHYVADIVGYFAPPVATALQCVETTKTIVADIGPGGTANANAPACAAGYTQTATNCETSSWLMPIVFSNAGTCSARNNDASPQDLRASRTCCRVPGR